MFHGWRNNDGRDGFMGIYKNQFSTAKRRERTRNIKTGKLDNLFNKKYRLEISRLVRFYQPLIPTNCRTLINTNKKSDEDSVCAAVLLVFISDLFIGEDWRSF
jgi:hypothetical protein